MAKYYYKRPRTSPLTHTNTNIPTHSLTCTHIHAHIFLHTHTVYNQHITLHNRFHQKIIIDLSNNLKLIHYRKEKKKEKENKLCSKRERSVESRVLMILKRLMNDQRQRLMWMINDRDKLINESVDGLSHQLLVGGKRSERERERKSFFFFSNVKWIVYHFCNVWVLVDVLVRCVFVLTFLSNSFLWFCRWFLRWRLPARIRILLWWSDSSFDSFFLKM